MSKPRIHKCPECGMPAFLLQRRERTHWTYIQVECDRAPDGCGLRGFSRRSERALCYEFLSARCLSHAASDETPIRAAAADHSRFCAGVQRTSKRSDAGFSFRGAPR